MTHFASPGVPLDASEQLYVTTETVHIISVIETVCQFDLRSPDISEEVFRKKAKDVYLNTAHWLRIWARMHEPGVSATPGLKSSYAGLACKVGMHDTVVTLLLA